MYTEKHTFRPEKQHFEPTNRRFEGDIGYFFTGLAKHAKDTQKHKSDQNILVTKSPQNDEKHLQSDQKSQECDQIGCFCEHPHKTHKYTPKIHTRPPRLEKHKHPKTLQKHQNTPKMIEIYHKMIEYQRNIAISTRFTSILIKLAHQTQNHLHTLPSTVVRVKHMYAYNSTRFTPFSILLETVAQDTRTHPGVSRIRNLPAMGIRKIDPKCFSRIFPRHQRITT